MASPYSILPFAAVFIAIDAITVKSVLPKRNPTLHHADKEALAGQDMSKSGEPLSERRLVYESRSFGEVASALVFGTISALSSTMVLLTVAKFANLIDAPSESQAYQVIQTSLIGLLFVLAPYLQFRFLVVGAHWIFTSANWRRLNWAARGIQLFLIGTCSFIFWRLGRTALFTFAMTLQTLLYGFTLLNAVSKPYFDELLRNSVLLLAFLTGIAALSILWHTASVSWKRHNITESTLAAALSELTEVREMLFPKRNVLRVLEAKERDSAPKYLLQPRWMKSFSFQRKQDEEAASLRVEVSDLEARETFLTSSLALMRSQHADIMHTSSTIKKILQPWFLLMIYCFYRVILAPLALGWRTSFLPRNVPYDPLNLLCGAFLHAKLPGYSALFWASTLNIGLCSVILVAGVNPVIAAFHHVARWIPGLLKHATADIKLALGHVSAIFVISGLFYLRNMPMLMPTEKSGDEPSNIMSFEYWFLAGSAMSALAVGLSHKTHFGGAREQRRSSHDADLGGIKIM